MNRPEGNNERLRVLQYKEEYVKALKSEILEWDEANREGEAMVAYTKESSGSVRVGRKPPGYDMNLQSGAASGPVPCLF